jgi:hypothetical protein
MHIALPGSDDWLQLTLFGASRLAFSRSSSRHEFCMGISLAALLF